MTQERRRSIASLLDGPKPSGFSTVPAAIAGDHGMGGDLRQTSPRLWRGLATAAAGLALVSCGQPNKRLDAGDPAQGEKIVERASCGSCHIIPSIPLAIGVVGPPLAHIGQRTVIAGELSNTPAHLALWVRAPQQVLPHNVMPSSGLSASQARDVAAFLETLR